MVNQIASPHKPQKPLLSNVYSHLSKTDEIQMKIYQTDILEQFARQRQLCKIVKLVLKVTNGREDRLSRFLDPECCRKFQRCH